MIPIHATVCQTATVCCVPSLHLPIWLIGLLWVLAALGLIADLLLVDIDRRVARKEAHRDDPRD